ncbi:MAG: glycosyltransferase [Actinomycetota bacterium]
MPPDAGSSDLSVSVVVCCRDRAELLEGALEAIGRSLRPNDDGIVVDSASRDSSVSDVAKRAGMRVVRLEQPGTSRARNAGAAASEASIVAYTDDDCLVPGNWTERLRQIFSERDTGFVTGAVVGDRDHALPASLVIGGERRRLSTADDPFALGAGSNMAFRKSVLTSAGGFDECLGPGAPLVAAEDVDLFWRLLRAEVNGLHEPSLSVTHRQWRTRTQSFGRHFDYGIGAGAFVAKAIRMGDANGWRILRRRLFRDGFGAAFRHLIKRQEHAALAELMVALGVPVGAARAARLTLRDGVFVPR